MRKFIIFMAAALGILMPAMAETTVDGFEFTASNGTATINGYTGTASVITLPETVTYNGQSYNCTTISKSAFKGNTVIEEVTIPEGYTTIENGTGARNFKETDANNTGAFYGASNLKKVTLPSTLTGLGNAAFTLCTALEEVTFPAMNLTNAGGIVFYGCSSLTSLDLSEVTITFGSLVADLLRSFAMNCTSLEQFTFAKGSYPKGSGVMNDMFNGCSKLSVVDLNGATLTEYSTSMFQNCSSLTSLDFPASLTSIGNNALTGTSLVVIDLSKTGLTALPAGMPATIEQLMAPKGLKTITAKAFQDNTKLKTLDFSASVLTSVGDYAFDGCTSLESLKYNPASSFKFSNYTYRNCRSLKELVLPVIQASGTAGYSGVFSGCSSLELVDLSKSQIERTPADMFKGCTSLATIKFPSTLTIIASNLFNDTAVENVVVGDPVDGALNLPAGINTLYSTMTFPKVKELDLSDLTELKSISISNNTANYIASGAELTSLVYPVNFVINTALTGSNVINAPKLESITLPANTPLSKIPQYFFKNLALLSEINLPAGSVIKEVGLQAFYGCASLSEFDLSNATTIAGSAFRGSGLVSADLSSATTLAQDSFRECSNLESVTFNDALADIPNNCFQNTALKALKLPASLKTIGNYAFATTQTGYTVDRLEFPHGLTSILSYAFQGFPVKAIRFGDPYAELEETPVSRAAATSLNIGTYAFQPVSTNSGTPSTIETVESYYTVPPTLSASAFNNSTYGNAELVVLPGTEDAYKAATGWKNFKKDVQTGVETVGAQLNGTAEYFDLNGRSVEAGELTPGLYIERSGSNIRKVIVK